MKRNWIYRMVLVVVAFVAMGQTALAQRAYYDTQRNIIICVCKNEVFKTDGGINIPDTTEKWCQYTDYVACDKCKRKWRLHHKQKIGEFNKYDVRLVPGSNRSARVGNLPHVAKEDSCYTVVKEVDKQRGKETVTISSYLCSDAIWCTVEGQATSYLVSPGDPKTIECELGASKKKMLISHKKPKAGTPVK